MVIVAGATRIGGVGMILVTGSSGLVGRHICARLEGLNSTIRPFDLKRSVVEDVCNEDAIERALAGVTGIIHLAAVSRVVHGERAPAECHRTNVEGLQTVLTAALRARSIPWFVFVSSREVYGNAPVSPTGEDTNFSALNTYARTKVAGERMVGAAREAGLTANICRLSTVYGSVVDHDDRVLPAFCRAAATGGDIHIDGEDVVLDPTHIDDVTEGLVLLAQQTAARELLPPIHFVGGQGYSLPELAKLAIGSGNRSPRIALRPPRSYDVKKFVGDPRRAKALLGWSAKTCTPDGMSKLVADFQRANTSLFEGTGAGQIAKVKAPAKN
jgi:nucleoside-diphosphate-sugar epimerase